MENEKKSSGTALTVTGIVLCVILIPILVANCTMIVKSYLHKDEVPDFIGVCPMIVLTDSMNSPEYPDVRFAAGDLIFCRQVAAEELQVGDVISFFDPAGNGKSVVTHRIVAIGETEEGELSFTTKGTNNNAEDASPVPASLLVGRYTGFKLPGAGNVAMFMQSSTGFVVCVAVPVVLLVVLDRLRMRGYEKKKKQEADALYAELMELKAMKAAGEPKENDAPSADAPQ